MGTALFPYIVRQEYSPLKLDLRMSSTAVPYLALKADDRQELRLPALLKEHAARVAALHGQSTSEYLVEIIATSVSADIAKSLTWDLSGPEVMVLLQALSAPGPETEAMRAARATAEELFGPVNSR